jgi:putative inorganic carbon (HCO3(-)) transporter
MEGFLSLSPGILWGHFKDESFGFWMICGYLFFEYVRLQTIIPNLNIIPWTQLYIILAALSIIASGKLKNKVPTSLNVWMILFFCVILLSSYTAYNSSISYNQMSQYYNWLIIFFLIQLIVNSEQRFFIFLLIFIIASYKLSLFGAKTWALRGFSFTSWGIRGPPGFFTNSSEYAAQMSVFFGISYYFYMSVKQYLDGWKLWIVAAAPITAMMSVMASSSRGAQLALAVQTYIIFLHGRISIKSFCSIAIILGAMLYFLPEEQKDRFRGMGEDKTSIQRLLYWEHGIDMMLDYPFLGVGYNNFRIYYDRFHSEDVLFEHAQLPHNIFIQVGADLGFVGLGIYLIMIWKGFSLPTLIRKRLIQQGKPEDWRILASKGLVTGFIGFVISGQFVSIVYYPYMWIHLALCCGLLNSTFVEKRNNEI